MAEVLYTKSPQQNPVMGMQTAVVRRKYNRLCKRRPSFACSNKIVPPAKVPLITPVSII